MKKNDNQVQVIKDQIEKLQETLTKQSQEIVENSNDSFGNLMESLREVGAELEKNSRPARKKATTYVKKNPEKVALITSGVIVGLALVSRIFISKDKK